MTESERLELLNDSWELSYTYWLELSTEDGRKRQEASQYLPPTQEIDS